MKVLSILFRILLFSFAPAGKKVEPADLILVNGNVYTANDKQPHAEAIAVKADRIVFAGSNAEVKKYRGEQTRVIDLQGATVVPGMTDAHHHLEGVGFREMTLNLEGITNLQDFLAKVKAKVDQTKRDWERAKQLGPGAVAQADLDAAQNAYQTAQASVRSMEAALQKAQTNVERAQSTWSSGSPGNGVIRATQ